MIYFYCTLVTAYQKKSVMGFILSETSAESTFKPRHLLKEQVLKTLLKKVTAVHQYTRNGQPCTIWHTIDKAVYLYAFL